MTKSNVVISAKTYQAELDFEDCEIIGKYIKKLEISAFLNGSQIGYLHGHILMLGEAHKDGQVRRILESTDEFEDMLITLFKGNISQSCDGDLLLNKFSKDTCAAFSANSIDVERQQAIGGIDSVNRDILLIEAVRVYQEFQAQGVGSMLLEKLALCKKVSPTIYLKASPFRADTAQDNCEQVAHKKFRLQAFYERFGFSVIPGTENEMVTTPRRMLEVVRLRQPSPVNVKSFNDFSR